MLHDYLSRSQAGAWERDKLLLGNAYSYGNLVKRDRVDLLEHWCYFDTEIRVVF
jgi:hypothetical protein